MPVPPIIHMPASDALNRITSLKFLSNLCSAFSANYPYEIQYHCPVMDVRFPSTNYLNLSTEPLLLPHWRLSIFRHVPVHRKTLHAGTSNNPHAGKRCIESHNLEISLSPLFRHLCESSLQNTISFSGYGRTAFHKLLESLHRAVKRCMPVPSIIHMPASDALNRITSKFPCHLYSAISVNYPYEIQYHCPVMDVRFPQT